MSFNGQQTLEYSFIKHFRSYIATNILASQNLHDSDHIRLSLSPF